MRPDQIPPILDFAAGYARRLLLVIAAVIVLGYVVVSLSAVVLPVLLALLIAALLVPAVEWLCRHGWPNLLASACVLLGSLAVVLALLGSVGPAVVSQADELAVGARQGLERVTTFVVEGPFGLSQADIDRRVQSLIDSIRGNLGGVAGRVVSGALLALNLFAGLVLTLFLTFFFVKDRRQMADWAVSLARPQWRADARELGRRVFNVLSAYAKSVMAVAFVDALLIGLALLAIGVPLVLPLAAVTFLGAFVPVIGAVLAGVLAALVALVTQGLTAALLVVVAILVVQQIEGNVLYPLLVGKSLRLHPAATILAVAAGSVLAGVVGALFAVPVAAAFSVVGRFLHERAHENPPPGSSRAPDGRGGPRASAQVAGG